MEMRLIRCRYGLQVAVVVADRCQLVIAKSRLVAQSLLVFYLVTPYSSLFFRCFRIIPWMTFHVHT